MQCVCTPMVTSRFAVAEARSEPKLSFPPPLSTLVPRATLHRRDAVTSTFSNARSGCPQVSRADFSTAYQLCPRLHRAGGAPMAARDQRIRGGAFERPFACIGHPMARHRGCPAQAGLCRATGISEHSIAWCPDIRRSGVGIKRSRSTPDLYQAEVDEPVQRPPHRQLRLAVDPSPRLRVNASTGIQSPPGRR
jgi:hypothetical protein